MTTAVPVDTSGFIVAAFVVQKYMTKNWSLI